jgi:hypothetical protein
VRQKSPESVRPTERLHAQWIRQDSAACVSLSSIYLSKSAGAKRPQTNGPAFLPPRRCENEARHPVTRGSLVSIRRLPAHCRTPVHGARTTLISLNRYPCQRLEQDYLQACRQRATSHVPQNGQHCGADEACEGRNGATLRVGSGDRRHWAFDTGARTGRNRAILADEMDVARGRTGDDTGDAHQASRTARSRSVSPGARTCCRRWCCSSWLRHWCCSHCRSTWRRCAAN